MRSVTELLHHVERAGGRIEVVDGRLFFEGPRRLLAPEVLLEVECYRAELLAGAVAGSTHVWRDCSVCGASMLMAKGLRRRCALTPGCPGGYGLVAQPRRTRAKTRKGSAAQAGDVFVRFSWPCHGTGVLVREGWASDYDHPCSAWNCETPPVRTDERVRLLPGGGWEPVDTVEIEAA